MVGRGEKRAAVQGLIFSALAVQKEKQSDAVKIKGKGRAVQSDRIASAGPDNSQPLTGQLNCVRPIGTFWKTINGNILEILWLHTILYCSITTIR